MAVTGHGARTPLGLDCRASAAAVRAGISAIADHPFMIDRFGLPMKVTRDAELDPGLPAECPASCPYLSMCHPTEIDRTMALPGDLSANRLPRIRRQPVSLR